MTGAISKFKPCALVPSFNHYKGLPSIVERLTQLGLPVIVVDDGSAEPAASAIAQVARPDGSVRVFRCPQNGGKGAAVVRGLQEAQALGFTHAVQVDADGQHDLDAVEELLSNARGAPDTLWSGRPIYESDAPWGRRIGRYVTHFWVWVETLSFQIKDTMCGLRVYPVGRTLEVCENEVQGRRMDFDIEVMVRMFWNGTPVRQIPVKVNYPVENHSNFDALRDNIAISKMHTRLVFSMLYRRLFGWVRPVRSAHWADQRERGTYWGIRCVATIYRLLGARAAMVLIAPVVAVAFLCSGDARRASGQYLSRARQAGVRCGTAWYHSFWQFLNFGRAALDKASAWNGDIGAEDVWLGDGVASLRDQVGAGQGIVVLVSHQGNPEVLRAVASKQKAFVVNIFAHTKHAENFNSVLRKLDPGSQAQLIEVTALNPVIAGELYDRVQRGEWLVIAADRTPVEARDNVVRIPFLGDEAAFPMGPFLISHLLECPVYMMGCYRRNGRFEVSWEKLADRVHLPRANRAQGLSDYAGGYAAFLEAQIRKAPYQWFNFFNFWAPEQKTR
ncbi:glycosyltransferase family 2 protein [Ruegeria sp.]|uniref:glycosyltransferase family 2 protein n=1 Tax=Ruegeria sp. TaxID=1879320 RepID=UPI003B5C56C1